MSPNRQLRSTKPIHEKRATHSFFSQKNTFTLLAAFPTAGACVLWPHVVAIQVVSRMMCLRSIENEKWRINTRNIAAPVTARRSDACKYGKENVARQAIDSKLLCRLRM